MKLDTAFKFRTEYVHMIETRVRLRVARGSESADERFSYNLEITYSTSIDLLFDLTVCSGCG